MCCKSIIGLQQHLPFTVLKLCKFRRLSCGGGYKKLQQHLPFTVLKQRTHNIESVPNIMNVATVLTVYGMRRRVSAEERSDDATLVFLTYNYISITKRAVLSVL